jgi:hypothetical protein
MIGCLRRLWQPAMADQGAGESEQRGQRGHGAVVAQGQASEAQQPRHGPFHDPRTRPRREEFSTPRRAIRTPMPRRRR